MHVMQVTTYMVACATIAITYNDFNEITYLKQELAVNGLVVFRLRSELR